MSKQPADPLVDRLVTFVCTGTQPTRRSGVFAIDSGYGGYGWQCSDCGARHAGYDVHSSEDTAAQSLRRHKGQAHTSPAYQSGYAAVRHGR